jgi:hypothetical protein
MFEETSSVPLKLEQKTFYRLSIGIWCLMVAILTNCYNGLMITDLNSPLPGSKIESFRDLLCDRSLFENNKDFNITKWIQTSNIASYWGFPVRQKVIPTDHQTVSTSGLQNSRVEIYLNTML